jgi:hypothetical protein
MTDGENLLKLGPFGATRAAEATDQNCHQRSMALRFS